MNEPINTERKFVINFEHQGDKVLFNNNVAISRIQFNALTRLRGYYTDSTPNFIWSELLRMPLTESTLVVYLSPIMLKRIQKEMDYLSESGFFNVEYKDVVHNNRKKIEATLFDVKPDFLAIIRLM